MLISQEITTFMTSMFTECATLMILSFNELILVDINNLTELILSNLGLRFYGYVPSWNWFGMDHHQLKWEYFSNLSCGFIEALISTPHWKPLQIQNILAKIICDKKRHIVIEKYRFFFFFVVFLFFFFFCSWLYRVQRKYLTHHLNWSETKW